LFSSSKHKRIYLQLGSVVQRIQKNCPLTCSDSLSESTGDFKINSPRLAQFTLHDVRIIYGYYSATVQHPSAIIKREVVLKHGKFNHLYLLII
jgi:hypothetical protein